MVASRRPPRPVSITATSTSLWAKWSNAIAVVVSKNVELAHLGLTLIDEIHHLLFGDHLAVDAYALAKILQVRRRVESHAIARLLEHRSQNVRHRPFAVGARHMNGVIVTLRIAQMTTKLDYALRPGFVGIGPHMLERGHGREEILDGL